MCPFSQSDLKQSLKRYLCLGKGTGRPSGNSASLSLNSMPTGLPSLFDSKLGSQNKNQLDESRFALPRLPSPELGRKLNFVSKDLVGLADARSPRCPFRGATVSHAADACVRRICLSKLCGSRISDDSGPAKRDHVRRICLSKLCRSRISDDSGPAKRDHVWKPSRGINSHLDHRRPHRPNPLQVPFSRPDTPLSR